MSLTPFFIIGSQRSGTTLLRLILDSHSEVECLDEEDSYEWLLAPAPRSMTLGLKVPQLTEQFTQNLLCDDAATRAGGRQGASNHYHDSSIIFLIRDPIDAVASMLKLDGWLKRYGLSVLAAKAAYSAGFAHRYRPEFDLIERSTWPTVAAAALIWRYKVDALFEYMEDRRSVLPLYYESLVARPRAALGRVCQFLNLPWQEGLLQHELGVHRVLDGAGLTVGRTDPHRPISTTSLGLGRAQLRPAQVQDIVAVAGSAYERLYGTATRRSDLADGGTAEFKMS